MRKIQILSVIFLLLIVGVLGYTKLNKKNANAQEIKKTEVYFLDVGQGDASFIKFQNGEKMLVDCGKDAKILSELGKIMPFADRRIDYLLITHPDNDHYGGCVDILDRFEVKNIFYNDERKENEDFWQVFWTFLNNENAVYHPIKHEEIVKIGDDVLDFLAPFDGLNQKFSDNNNSVVFMLESGGVKVIFTGDAEKELEEKLAEKYKEKLDADILKVSHHGSKNSSISEFLELVTPEYSVISVGKNNYGHPSPRVVKKLERFGSVFRTDENDNIFFVLDSGAL